VSKIFLLTYTKKEFNQDIDMNKLLLGIIAFSTFTSIANASNLENCTIGLKSYVPTTYEPLILLNQELKHVDLVPRTLVTSKDLTTRTFKYGKQRASDCKLRFDHYVERYQIIESAHMKFGDESEHYERRENTCSINIEKFPSSVAFLKLPKMNLPQNIESYQFDGSDSRVIKLVNTTLTVCMDYALSIREETNDKMLKETLEINNEKITLTSKYLESELFRVQNQGTGNFIRSYKVRDVLDESYENGFSLSSKLPKIQKQHRLDELNQGEPKELNGQPRNRRGINKWLESREELKP
jgi:hypothetical protein